MYSKFLILRFSQAVVSKPIICQLVKQFDLTFNILKATVFPRKEGIAVIELSGTRKNFKEGIKYLESQGVEVQNAAQEIKRSAARCTQCGACTAVCPTGALFINRPEMTVSFDQKKCSVCELCLPACPTRAMEIRPTNSTFF
jgi:ferredoxin